MNFRNLFWIVHQLGFAGDTLCCFLNIHAGRMKKYHLVRGRARSTIPGILLNWAWYYPKWQRVQKKDPNLYKSLHYLGTTQFSQAHFFNREDQLLDLFPGSQTITVLAAKRSNAMIYNRYAHYKLLDKKLYPSWYLKQQMNFPLTNPKNQRLADDLFLQDLTVGQYRAIAYMDWNELTLDDLHCDPLTLWHEKTYHTLFQENLSTALINNENWIPYFDQTRQKKIYIDKLVDPETGQFDNDYYAQICDELSLVPDFDFYHEFWQDWLNKQPPVDYEPNLKWPY